MSRDLKAGVSALETMTAAGLAILAMASGVYTYIGVRGLLDGDGGLLSFGAAAIYSFAVSVGIFLFWTYILRFFPLLRHPGEKAGMLAAMALGSLAIIAMSSWLNAAALAGSAAIEQHLAQAVEDSQQRLEQAHENALAAQSLLPDIELAASRFEGLAAQERAGGSLTGTRGSGTVVELLSQMQGQLRDLSQRIRESREDVDSLYRQGIAHLTTMRRLVAGKASVDARSVDFAEQAVLLAGVVTALEQTSIAPALRRAAEDLTRNFIRPVPDGVDAALRTRQQDVIAEVEEAIAQQSGTLADAADEILQRPPVEPLRFTPLSTAEAVLLYAEDFVPSWAGAISIDLMPGVLVLIIAIVQGAIRRADAPRAVEETMTLHELTQALDALKRLEDKADGLSLNSVRTAMNNLKTPRSPDERP